MTAGAVAGPTLGHRVTSDEALMLARLDAETAYPDLSPYRIRMALEGEEWHVDFELRDANLNGGGPHYVIDARTGEILSKRYEQ